MLTEYTFTDRNKDFRTYHTINDNDGNYSTILFHKVKWSIADCTDIVELENIWAENIMQSIIDGYMFGDFEVMINEVEYFWLHWEIITVWNKMNIN